VPKSIITRLNAALNKSLASPALRQRFAAIGAEPGGGTPQQFSDLIRKEYVKWGEVIRRSGARIN
jgi:tripartite-type tricarboxylate transporter receptor subunit TctC